MRLEKSCGAVIFKDNLVLLVQSKKYHHWSFPKGHMEKGETELETANREILEETNIIVDIDPSIYSIIQYSPFPNVLKEVQYFYAIYKEGKIMPQDTEISDILWLSVEDAMNKITFEQEKKVLIDIINKLK